MSIDLFQDDLDALKNNELFAAIADFAKAMPSEGWRHDYTVRWEDSALRKVAAFANTFGGLLIVGVKKEKTDSECELIGVESEMEYKTRVASSIAANISPVPSYRIYECQHPKMLELRFCVIRVSIGKSLYLITKKGMDPVYIRNEDEARPANAAELRRLIEREKEAPMQAEQIAARAHELLTYLYVGHGYKSDDRHTWQSSLHENSQTFLKLALFTDERLLVEFEKSHEDRFLHFIEGQYPRLHNANQVSLTSSERGADYYQYSWYHKTLDHEERWRATASGGVGHAAHMGSNGFWSIVDVATYTVLFVQLSLEWWKSIGYMGAGHLHARISLPGLTPSRSKEGWYNHLFDPTYASDRPSVGIRSRRVL